jgi:hypothetical protein
LVELRNQRFDCMALDLELPDISGFGLIEMIQREMGQEMGRFDLPIVV